VLPEHVEGGHAEMAGADEGDPHEVPFTDRESLAVDTTGTAAGGLCSRCYQQPALGIELKFFAACGAKKAGSSFQGGRRWFFKSLMLK
jgi:hypothetical protein